MFIPIIYHSITNAVSLVGRNVSVIIKVIIFHLGNAMNKLRFLIEITENNKNIVDGMSRNETSDEPLVMSFL